MTTRPRRQPDPLLPSQDERVPHDLIMNFRIDLVNHQHMRIYVTVFEGEYTPSGRVNEVRVDGGMAIVAALVWHQWRRRPREKV